MSAILDGNLRIVYFAEIFPSASETWVHHEIDELQRLGCIVKVFATQARPSNLPRELEHFLDITTYLPELPRSAFQALCRILNYNLIRKVAAGILFDAKGIRLKAQVLRDLLFAGYLSPLVAEFRPDYVFAHFAGTRTNLAMFHALLLRVPFGFKMHAYDVFNRVSLFRLKVSTASNIFTISNYNVSYIAEHYPDIDASRIQVHRCGIPLDHYKYRSSRLADEVPLFLAVGRLVKMKGFDALVRASSWLRDGNCRHRVVIIGDGPERVRLESMALELNLEDTVTFAGYAAPATVINMLLEATAFVLPAVWDPVARTQDGIPVALIEAMALGVPVVSSFTSGIPELVEDGVSGFLCPSNNPVALGEKLKKLCAFDLELKKQLTDAARRKVERNHDAKCLARELRDAMATSAHKERIGNN